MTIWPLAIQSDWIKNHIKQYALWGFVLSVGLILLASLLSSYQLTGRMSLIGLLHAHSVNPALWVLDFIPFLLMFGGWMFIQRLGEEVESIVEGKARDIALKSDELASKLKFESHHNRLTHLPNKDFLTQRVQLGMQYLHQGESLALIVLKINKLQAVNEAFGRSNTNQLLVLFAEKLKSILIEPYMLQPYMGMNIVARLQGAEFAVLIPRLREDHDLKNILEQIIQSTTGTYVVDDNNISITTTAGVALYPKDAEDADALIHCGTQSVFYAEKAQTPYAFYKPGMEEPYKAKQLLFKGLQEAVLQEEIQLLYQPVIDLNTKRIVSVEAGLYFDNEHYGRFDVDRLIPMVQGSDLAHHLTMLILKKSIEQLKFWQQTHPELSLIVHLFDLREDDTIKVLQDHLTKHDLKPEDVSVEFTEQTFLTRTALIEKGLEAISNQGTRVMLREFSRHCFSWPDLARLPIHALKLGKLYTENLPNDDKKQQLLKAIYRFTTLMNLEVVIETIEDKNTLRILEDIGFIQGEGGYFSEPVPAEQFESVFKAVK